MNKGIQVIFGVLNTVLLGCATGGPQFYDSALNDRNRAPSSISVPRSFDSETPMIDATHNQVEADYLFLKADMDSQAGKTTDSIESLKSALVYDPEAPTLMQKLAVEYYKRGQTRDALYWAEKARDKSPDRRDLVLLVGGLYTTTKNYAKAEQSYLSLLKKDKDDAEATLYLGAVYSEMKNYKKSIQYFSSLTKSSANYSSKHLAYYYWARILIEQGQKNSTPEVHKLLKKSIEIKPDYFDAVSLLGQLIQKESGTVKAYDFYANHQKKFGPNAKLAELLSQYYIEKNQYDKAYEQLEIIDASADDMVQVKLKMALILIDKKQYNASIAKLQEILQIAPESDKVRFYLSAVYEEKKEFQNAFDEYMKVSKQSTYFEESRVHAAYLAKLMGQQPKAIEVLQESINYKIENPQSYFLMTQFYEEAKEFNKSLDVLKLAEQKFPKNPQVYFYKGTIQDKLNLKKDMVSSMKKVLELDKDHVQAMNYLAFSWAEMNQELESAEQLARQAAAKEKNDAFILDTLGWVLYKKGLYKEATDILEKAHEMQPTVGIISEHLGDVYIKLQKLDKARGLFLKASETETDADHKKDIEFKLTQIENKIKDQTRKPASIGSDLNTIQSP